MSVLDSKTTRSINASVAGALDDGARDRIAAFVRKEMTGVVPDRFVDASVTLARAYTYTDHALAVTTQAAPKALRDSILGRTVLVSPIHRNLSEVISEIAAKRVKDGFRRTALKREGGK